MLDVGANAEVRPEHLVQFAFMGAALASTVLGIQRPRVALLSNGTEAIKGTPLVQEAHKLLQERAASSPLVDFVGNTEGNVVMDGVADVVVADGFTGNVALKLIEGISSATLRSIREAADGSTRGKLGGLLLRGDLRALRAEIDPEAQGGAYLLGLRKLGVVPHGRFSAPASPRRSCWPRAVCATTSSGAPTPRSRRPEHSKVPRHLASDSALPFPSPMTREDVFTLIRDHLADELDLDAGADRGRHALQGGPGGRLARPLHAGAGARGLLRREDDRRAGRADPLRGSGGRLRPRPRA